MASIRAGTPFRAAKMMALAIASIQGAFARDLVMQRTALESLGPYEGRGKKRTRTHFGPGTRANQRAAAKRRNVIRNRRAHRG